ncbi:MAG TPA: hypothetical protein VGI85_15445 [Chthoniobacterales bacterium]|jgi:hypothetical protein
MKLRLFVRLTAIFALLALAGDGGATGYFGPAVYLDEGGRRLTASPEFYWELETKRLTRDFHPPEKLGPRNLEPFQTPEDRKSWQDRVTAEADASDFAEALRDKRITPTDPAGATRRRRRPRDAGADQPNEYGNFAAGIPLRVRRLSRGAFAYRRGPEHWEESRQAWENLLKRPEPERHYRSVWAAFMLGKIAMKQNNPAAAEWFERTRALAAALAIDAAELLPNDSEELADVVNCAGLWVKEADEKLADHYYDILERRGAKTMLGRAVIKRHWFVDQLGPWSQEQKQAQEKMRQELKIPAEY